mmetsp:Transcript_35346/g.76302  ORF Transcript_35346/g.76302 Transcript_35346/m.76302 type:complete len:226 (+) Transcript_35346:102-779(+)
MQRAVLRASKASTYTALPSLTKAPGGATLPQLPFDWKQGCPPVFSAHQLELHYTKHHNAYVTKLNQILGDKLEGETIEAIAVKAKADGDGPLFNQAAQHFNHSFYFAAMKPNAPGSMPAELETALTKDFESVDAFKTAFMDKAVGNFGSGWTWLVYDTADAKLKIVNTGNAGMPEGTQRPVLTMDVWEHAYYVDFENRRPDYSSAFFKIVDWEVVAANLARAKAE